MALGLSAFWAGLAKRGLGCGAGWSHTLYLGVLGWLAGWAGLAGLGFAMRIFWCLQTSRVCVQGRNFWAKLFFSAQSSVRFARPRHSSVHWVTCERLLPNGHALPAVAPHESGLVRSKCFKLIAGIGYTRLAPRRQRIACLYAEPVGHMQQAAVRASSGRTPGTPCTSGWLVFANHSCIIQLRTTSTRHRVDGKRHVPTLVREPDRERSPAPRFANANPLPVVQATLRATDGTASPFFPPPPLLIPIQPVMCQRDGGPSSRHPQQELRVTAISCPIST